MFDFLEDFRYTRWVKKLNRTTQVILSLLLVCGLNFVAARHFTRWDLTPTHRYSLSAETMADLDQTVRKNLQTTPRTPLELILVTSPSRMNDTAQVLLDQIRTLLAEYKDAGSSLPGGKINLTIEEVDYDRQLDRAKLLLQYSPMVTFPEVLVKFGDRVRALSEIDLYQVEKDKSNKNLDPTKFRGENAVTSAILDVVQKKTDKIYFTTGHGECSTGSMSGDGLSEFADALRLRDYKLAEINLANYTDVPADAKVVVITLPPNVHSAFTPEEQEKLRRYLNQQNGRIMLLVDMNIDPRQTTGLENLLREWGLHSPNLRVIEEDPAHLEANYGAPLFAPDEQKNLAHAITESLGLTGQQVEFGLLRPVDKDPDATDDAQSQVHNLLATTANTYEVPPNSSGNNVQVIAKGSQVVAAISERQSPDAVALPGGKLLVYGSTGFITNNMLSRSANLLLALNSVNYLANHETMLNIRSKTSYEPSLGITTAQLEGLGWRLALLPAAMALLGLVVCWIRYRS